MSCKNCELIKKENDKLKLIVEGLNQKIDLMSKLNEKIINTIAAAAKIKLNNRREKCS